MQAVLDSQIVQQLEYGSSGGLQRSHQPAGDQRRSAIMQAEAAILSRNAAIPMLHERVIQGEAAGVTGVDRDPRERTLITVTSTIK